MKDAKYLLAYLVPASAALALAWKGPWAWVTVLLVFGLLPLIELFLPQSTDNVAETEEPQRSRRRFFDWLLYLNAPMVFGTTLWFLHLVAQGSLGWAELLGLTLSVGIVIGANGINVAHELGHRDLAAEQHLAKLMLLPALYQHFFVEHNRGHHKHIATELDPASARLGEWLYAFWWRSVTGGWRSAWALEGERLRKAGRSFWGWDNAMLRFSAYQTLWLSGVYVVFDWQGLLAALAVAVVGFLLLETVNYIEHYGLRRRQLASGRYEPVSPQHSWNSNHELGRIFLYELTRHSDHHFKATRKYQILRHMDESPQMPLGYPGSMLIALVPPLWFATMNPRVRQLAA